MWWYRSPVKAYRFKYRLPSIFLIYQSTKEDDMEGKKNIAAGLLFLAAFMIYGFILIYLRYFARQRRVDRGIRREQAF